MEPIAPTLMDVDHKKRATAAVALLVLTPAVAALLSGCSSDCDNNRSTPQTSDDCGTGTYSGGGYHGGYFGGGRGWGGSSARGGFGGFGHGFSGGG